MAIHADQRSIDSTRRDDLHKRLLDSWEPRMGDLLDLARDLAGILDSGHYIEDGCASLIEYARKYGYHGQRGWTLARLGQAVNREPCLAEDIFSKRIPIENAEAVAPIFLDDRYIAFEDGSREIWRERAATFALSVLRHRVKLVIEKVERSEEKLTSVNMLLSDDDQAAFRRARALLNAKAERKITEGEAVGELARYFLKREDKYYKALIAAEKAEERAHKGAAQEQAVAPPKAIPDERAAKKADVAETSARTEPSSDLHVPPVAPSGGGGSSRSRYIPAILGQALWRRSCGRCEVPGCIWTTGLAACHVWGFAKGGPHSFRNVVVLCGRHHVMLDAGWLRVVGWTGGPDAPESDRPMFRDRSGKLLPPEVGPDPPDLLADRASDAIGRVLAASGADLLR